jgi:aspartate 1-decarboxylase
MICVNGAAAHLNRPGEIVILATFAEVSAEEARDLRPTIVFVDGRNRRIALPPGTRRPPVREQADGIAENSGN